MVIAMAATAGQAFADYNVTISNAAGANGVWSGGTPDVWTPGGAGSNVSVAEIQTRLATGVTITTAGGGAENGDILVNNAVSWSADTTFTLSAYRNVNVNANITATGNTAGLVLTPNIGSGGGIYSLNNGAVITLSGANPSLTIAGNAYTVINDVNALQNMGSGLSGRYVLGSNIDASVTSGWNAGEGFAPVGVGAVPFTGAFDGLNHTITGLNINRPGTWHVGLFGYANGSTIRNVGLLGGSVTGTYVGGLVGYNFNGTVTNSYSTGSVTGTGDYAGGLVGGTDSSTITSSYSTGSVSGGSYVGGLVGTNGNAIITNSYSTGSVSGSSCVGGLVGYNYFGTVTNSYSTGTVSGSGANVGGLVGLHQWGTITSSYWDTQTSGQAGSAGGIGLTTAQMMQQSNFTSWDFANTWWISEGNTRSFLRMEYSTTISNAHQLQLMGMNATTLAANYTLAADINMAELRQASGLWNTTTGFAPVGSGTPFTGVFDGLNHTITGLYINRPGTGSDVGLFGYANGSDIHNVGLVGGSVTGANWVGGLVGFNHNCTVTNSYSTGSVSGGSYVGGLVGVNDSVTITNSYSTGSVAGTGSYVGGLVGYNNSTITSSYSTGAVSGISYVGGLVGANSGTITNSYWDTQTSGQAVSAGGIGLTTAQMMQQANFSSWDFTDKWRIYAGHTYPFLKSFLIPLTITADNASKIHDGIAYISALTNPGYSVVGADTSGRLFNTVNPYNGATEVGSYTPDLYSNQQGYDISYVNGTLTINAVHTVTGEAIPPAGGNISCTSPAVQGTGTTCDITANVNYHLASISAGLGCGRTPADYTYTAGTGNTGTTSVSSFATGTVTANCTVTADFELDSYTVTGTVAGGSGGVACDTPAEHGDPSTCILSPSTGWFTSGVTDNLNPTVGWTNTSYTIQNVTEGHTVQVQFSEYPVKRISSSTVYHMTIQEAYNAAADSGDIIQALATTPFGGGLTCERQNVSVTIQGGFDSDFGTNPGFTIINTGIMTISDGEVTVDRIRIE